MSADLNARLVVDRGSFHLDAELTIDAGQTVALLGPNGAGKSTAVAVLAGLLPLDEGHIRLGGRTLDEPAGDVFLPADQRRIGVVFQDNVLFPNLSVIENVAFGLRSAGVTRSSARKTAAAWLDRFEIDSVADQKPADLSGGQAQRVALARALVIRPDMLLLDEPLSALDVTTRARLRHVLLDHLADFPGPRLLITHDPTEAFLLADEVHVIESGAVTQVGGPDDIRLRPRTSYIADLAGSNLLVGVADDGVVALDNHQVTVADRRASGPVLATVHPRAISLHRGRPEGSPRNTWETVIARVEHYGDRVRLQTGEPLPLTVEITPGSVATMGLGEGSPVWVSIKATEINVAVD